MWLEGLLGVIGELRATGFFPDLRSFEHELAKRLVSAEQQRKSPAVTTRVRAALAWSVPPT